MCACVLRDVKLCGVCVLCACLCGWGVVWVRSCVGEELCG